MPVVLSGTNGVTFPDSSLQTAAASPYVLKNRIINGAMQVWQRGTSYALTNGYAYGSADRWAFIQVTSANGIANQVASGVSGFQYALKVGRNSGATQTGQIIMLQAEETSNSVDLAGNTVTLSFYAKAGANFSGTTFKAVISSGTGTDQSVATMGGGSWTGYAETQTSYTLTTSMVKYTASVTLASNVTQVGVYFTYTPVGTAGADDNFYITGVQLEVGSTATPFERRLYGQELINCQRYYQLAGNGATGRNYSATSSEIVGMYKVNMRASPTATFGGFSGSQALLNQFSIGNVTMSSLLGYSANTTASYYNPQISGGTTGTFVAIIAGDAFALNAEL